MKIGKIDGRLKWYANMPKMSQIRAFTQVPLDKHFYACGDYGSAYVKGTWPDTREITSAVFRMRNDGTMLWYSTISGSHPTAGYLKQDRCKGLAYDYKNRLLSVLIEGKMSELRTNAFSKGKWFDNILVMLDMNGGVRRASQVSWGAVQYDMFLNNNALIF